MQNTVEVSTKKKKKNVSYAKWGYIFIIPFFVVYLIFTLYPQVLTVGYSFFEYYYQGSNPLGPTFAGFDNYVTLFKPAATGEIMIFKYFLNTLIMWVIGAVPQFGLSLLLAVLFTSSRLNLKFQGFFKSVFYAPNLIMAASFSLLFYILFDNVGPVNDIIQSMGGQQYKFLANTDSARLIIASINLLMWFGNTTIMLMAGIQGIDDSIFESAKIDGAGSGRVFTDITMPLLKPIFVYVFITSMIGGIQMYDVPQIMTDGKGAPDNTTNTVVMFLSKTIQARNYGKAGAISMVLFVITAVLSVLVFRTTNKED